MKTVKKYRKKPVVIEAYLWIGEYDDIVKPYEHPGLCDDEVGLCPKCGGFYHLHGSVESLEGQHIVCPGDYIIKGIQGEYYLCKPDIFDTTYEEVEENDA